MDPLLYVLLLASYRSTVGEPTAYCGLKKRLPLFDECGSLSGAAIRVEDWIVHLSSSVDYTPIVPAATATVNSLRKIFSGGGANVVATLAGKRRRIATTSFIQD